MTHEISGYEEIIRRSWPVEIRDAANDDESHWDILNEDSNSAGLNRHWFKPTQTNRTSPDASRIIYH
jgi:hypothetical protein